MESFIFTPQDQWDDSVHFNPLVLKPFMFMCIVFHIWNDVYETEERYLYEYLAGDEVIDWVVAPNRLPAEPSELKSRLRVCACGNWCAPRFCPGCWFP